MDSARIEKCRYFRLKEMIAILNDVFKSIFKPSKYISKIIFIAPEWAFQILS